MDSLATTSAVVECTVTGITTALADVKWYDSSGGELTDTAEYTIVDGTLSAGEVQTTTLTVINGVTEDTTYQCEIHNIKYPAASINVYSKFI